MLLIVILSLAIKLALFFYAALNAPDAKFMPDTITYLKPGVNLVEKGLFGIVDDEGGIKYEKIRTPGYPLFLGLLTRTLDLSFDAVIIIQILLVTLAGFIVYKAGQLLDKKIAILSAVFFLFDLPVTISSLMLLTEALYTFFMALFMYLFFRYLKEYRLGILISSALILALATYIRPISYYLAICLGCGVFYLLLGRDIRKCISHTVILLLIFYLLVGLWQYRNFVKTENADFTTVDNIDLTNMGLTHKYRRDGGFEYTGQSPFMYYADRSIRSFVEFFTLPGTLKYFKSKPLKVVSKIYGYGWVGFWLAGLFFAGFKKIEQRFLFFTILYFATVSVIVIGLCISSRLRVPVMPLISILAANGWARISNLVNNKMGTWFGRI